MKDACPTYRDLGDINSVAWSEAIIDFNTKGSITQQNIGDLMIRSIKTMFPDVSKDDPSKRVIWFTDNHGSRFDTEFVDRLASMGVHLFGWMPNTTSKCQSMDVKVFGKLKATIQAISKRRKQYIDEGGKIEIVKEALRKCAKPDEFLEGLRKTGMLPFSRKILLDHPAVQLGKSISTEERYEVAFECVKAIRGLENGKAKTHLASKTSLLRERGLPFDTAKVWMSTGPDKADAERYLKEIKRRLDALRETLKDANSVCQQQLLVALHAQENSRDELLEKPRDADLLKKFKTSSEDASALFTTRTANYAELDFYTQLDLWYSRLAHHVDEAGPDPEAQDLEKIIYDVALLIHFLVSMERVGHSDIGSPELKKGISAPDPLVLQEVSSFSNAPLLGFGQANQVEKKKKAGYQPMHATNILMANDHRGGGSTELTDESRRKRIRTLAHQRQAKEKETKRVKRTEDAYNRFKENEARILKCVLEKRAVPMKELRQWVNYRRSLVLKIPQQLAAIDEFNGKGSDGHPLFTKDDYKSKALKYFNSTVARSTEAV